MFTNVSRRIGGSAVAQGALRPAQQQLQHSRRLLGAASSLRLGPQSGGLANLRAFSTAETTQERVLKAVQNHLNERIEDVKKDMEESNSDKDALEKQLLLLQKEPSSSSQWTDFGFDEFDRVEVLLEVEEAFDILIPDQEADSINGITDTVNWMDSALAEAERGDKGQDASAGN